MKRSLSAFVLLTSVLLLLMGMLTAPAGAADDTYQVPSDGSHHTIAGHEPTLANVHAEGCHGTAFYNPDGAGGYAPQRAVYCVWIGYYNHDVGPGSQVDDAQIFALKWECYHEDGTVVRCEDFNVTANLRRHDCASSSCGYDQVTHQSRCYATASGSIPQCASGVNNTGWMQPDTWGHPYDYVWGNLIQNNGTDWTLEDDYYGYTSYEYFDGSAVGQALTLHWAVHDAT